MAPASSSLSRRPHPLPNACFLSMTDPYPSAEYLPLAALVIPILGSWIHGSIISWQNSILLCISLGYLIHLLKFPWTILHAAHARRAPASVSHPQAPAGQPSAAAQARGRRASRELACIELLAFIAVLASPLAGAALLRWLKLATSHSTRYVDPSAVRLFTLAASMKPLSYLLGRLRTGTPFRTIDVSATNPKAFSLELELARVQQHLFELDSELAEKSELEALRQDAQLPLRMLGKAMRQKERHDSAAFIAHEVNFSNLEKRLQRLRIRFSGIRQLQDRLERDAEEYTRSRQAMAAAWFNSWLDSAEQALLSLAERFESEPQLRRVGNRGLRPGESR